MFDNQSDKKALGSLFSATFSRGEVDWGMILLAVGAFLVLAVAVSRIFS